MKSYFLPFALSVGFASLTSLEAALKVGAATSDITPPLGSLVVGNFIIPPAEFVHDPLKVRAIVVENESEKLALVVVDLIGLRGEIAANARQRIEAALGIPQQNILISCTHTHSGTHATGTKPAHLAAGHENYGDFVTTRIVDSVINAHHVRRDAEMGQGSFHAPEYVKNRRWIMKEGSAVSPFGDVEVARMNPPAGSADLIKPAGPVNDKFSYLAFREPSGEMIALYANYSLHYVDTGAPKDLSADYFGVYCEELAQRLKPKATFNSKPFVAALSNGTFGDINKNDYSKPIPKAAPYESIYKISHDLVTRTEKSLKAIQWTADVPLAASLDLVELKLRVPTPELKEKSQKILKETPEVPGKVSLPRIYAQRVLSFDDSKLEVKAPVQVLRIGDSIIGTMPGEIFAETGLEFMEKVSSKQSFLVGIAHESHGYLPTLPQIKLGGYETWFGTCRLEFGAAEKMLDVLVQRAKELSAP